MATLALMGSLGIGLMWGWLLILVSNQQPQQPERHILLLLIATAVMVSQIYSMNGLPAVWVFLITAVFSGIIHLSWRRRLRQQ